jgi:hypothetical protein
VNYVMACVVAALALAGAGCKDVNPQLATGDSPSTVLFPTSGVSFQYHVQPLFSQACNFSGCHDNAAAQNKLILTSYSSLMYQLPGIVVSGKPDASMLILRVQGTVGDRMPPTTNRLNDNQILGLRTWVAEGAKNN